MPVRPIAILRVRRAIGPIHAGRLIAGGLALPCALGRSGLRPAPLKREGDGTTPTGCFRILRQWRRPDRWRILAPGWPARRIGPADGWCENPGDRRYNRPVRLAPGEAHDRLWREDRLYDLVLELDHNARPRIAGRGSAVFVHLCRPGRTATAGCVALDPADLRRLLPRLARRTAIEIH